MQVLKGLVIGMGLLIAAGMALFAYGLYQKIADPEFTFFPGDTGDEAPAAAPAPADLAPRLAAPGAFGTIAVPLPEGCILARVIPEGDRLYLRIGPAGRCERVVVVDVATGSVLGTITVGP
ncbi:MAG: hypothetical protein IID50_06870 [Proteobacteria bacterium]|nr:hypothetical protein [Pseudomonadota bacterium]